MNLFYEGRDITGNVDIKSANIIESSGSYFDNIIVNLNNSVNQWSEWKPKKTDRLELSNKGFSSGTMYIDEILQKRAAITLKAIPLKQRKRQTNTKPWEEIRLMELLNEVAQKHDLRLKTYNIENYLYSKVNQIEQSDFSFIQQRCMIEGYVLKILNGEMIVYDERHMEGVSSGLTVDISEIDGDFDYLDKSFEIYGSCNIVSGDINYTYTPSDAYGPALNIKNILASNLAEAQRFARNCLRNKNKYERTLTFSKKLDAGITAGNTVEVKNFGLPDGRYYVYQAKHNLANETTQLFLRGILEGY